MRQYGYGLVAVAIITIGSNVLGSWFSTFNAVLWALLLGVALGNLLRLPAEIKPGVDFASKDILNWAIIFLAFDVSARQISDLGWGVLGSILAMVITVLAITYALARLFKCRTSTGWLVGFGTAICGSSAIAALSGSVSSDKEDVGIALAVVNLLGLAGMLAWPALLPLLDRPDDWSGMLIGGTLHAVGNVAGAGYAVSDEAGQLAITIKLGRVAMLAPGLIFFNWLVHRKAAGWQAFKLPYYVWGFLAIVILISVLPVPASVLQWGKTIGKTLLTAAMAAIGLKISIGKLFETGRIALGFGVVIFLVQTFLLLALMQWW
ncbi:MAG: putative sulfate exporter family transporter [Saprospiraceae bacterium]